MKGLLLKDFYMTIKYCRTYMFISIAFLAISFVDSNNFFFAFYPCMLSGMIPVSLLGYDERSGWLQYGETMPYTRTQIVCGKYLIGLLAQMAMLIITGIARAIQMRVGGSFNFKEYVILMTLLFAMSLAASSISLPFMFKVGVEKGRMAYYFMVGVGCGGSALLSNVLSKSAPREIKFDVALPIICIVAVAIYSLSWYLSVVFYNKREL